MKVNAVVVDATSNGNLDTHEDTSDDSDLGEIEEEDDEDEEEIPLDMEVR